MQRCDPEILEPGEYKNSEMNVNGDPSGNSVWFLPLAHFYHLSQDAWVIKSHVMVRGKVKRSKNLLIFQG